MNSYSNRSAAFAINSMSLADLEKSAAATADKERSERARIASQDRDRDRDQQDHDAIVAAMRSDLARDLRCDPTALIAALLEAETRNVGSSRTRGFVWLGLRQVTNQLNPVDVEAARCARHALGAMGGLPKVKAADRTFGTEAQARALPAVEIQPPDIDCVTWSPAKIFGLNEPKPDATPRPNANEIVARRYHDDFDTDRAMAARAVELADAAHRSAHERARNSHRAALVDQRKAILAVVDRTLASLEIGEAWWWARHLRRRIAGERPIDIAGPFADFPVSRILETAQALGARFDFTAK